jgi:gliding motility-associated-like protein
MGLLAFGQSMEFIENKGQWDSQVKFRSEVSGGAFFIHNNGFTVLQHNSADWKRILDKSHHHDHPDEDTRESHTLRSHAYRVEFLDGNGTPAVSAEKPIITQNNYFVGNDPSKWASGCKIYQAVTIKNIYPNIDVRYYSDRGYMKYDLIVHPGGDPSRIALRYKGADKLEIKNRELVVKTSVGDIKELSPYSYQYDKKRKSEVAVKFSLEKDVVRFNIKEYDPKSTLVIDPTLIFATFSGSTTDNWGFTATYGPDGSMYGGGTVFNQGNGFPVSPGAFQQTHAGGEDWDIGIIRLSADGSSRIYATYIGGSGNDQPHSLVADGQGNLVIAGRTRSANYPTTGSNPVLGGPGGNYDIVVTKLNANGTALIGSKRIGGSADDGVNISANRGLSSLQRNYGDDGRSEVILDNAGNIYVASCTRSTNLIANGFQSNNRGEQDGLVLKLDPNVSNLLFASYLGGSENDAAYVLALNPVNNNIYVAGGTESSDFNGPTAGTVGPATNGSIDGFISIFSNDGSVITTSAYIGTGGIDQIFGIQFDNLGFPYIMGQTTGFWQPFNATWSQTNGKQFIAKLQPNLSAYVYSTTFGTPSSSPNISPIAFLVDRCENVYVSGWGGLVVPQSPTFFPSAGTAGLPITPDAIKSTTDGRDLYFFVLKKDATAQLYGSFFGQDNGATDHVDGGTSRFDRNGVIYQAVCANCKTLGAATNIPTTPGSWSSTNPATNNSQCNLMMIKISFDLAGVGSGIQSAIDGVPRDTAGCVPLTVDFRDTIQNAVSYEWNFGDGSGMFTSTTANFSHTFTQVGTYRVMLVAIDSTTCNIRDTSYMNIRVGNLEAELNFSFEKLDPCFEFKYRFDNLSTAPAVRPFTNTSFIWDFGDNTPRVTGGLGSVTHSFASPGTYNVKLILNDDAYCNYPDSVVIPVRVAANVKAKFETPPTGCAPYAAVFTNVSEGGQSFQWDFGDGNTSTASSPTHTYTVPGTYTVTLVANDPATCNLTDTFRFTITIYGLPTADFSASPQPPQVNVPITFTNLSSPDAVKFKWLFGDGDSLVTASRASVQHEYNATRTYTACLIAYNANNCADTICRNVSTLIEPAVDVPTAFTPLSGDINSQVFVRGFGIARMKFTIWARWGEKVFETDSKKTGWDGRYKGKLLPMDAYAYTLDIEFSDGTKTTKKGDITLIR